MRTRFAPSPTGRLHLGHAFSAFAAFDAAAEAGGTCLLRIEDIDAGRSRPEFEAAIYQDLSWLGLTWPAPVRRQSEHLADYAAALGSLREAGLVYRCFKTRKEVAEAAAGAPHPPPGALIDGPAYVGAALPAAEEAARLADGAAFAWRLSMAGARRRLGARWDTLTVTEESGDGLRAFAATPAVFGDVVLARKDVPASYHLAAVHDDALQRITHVIRGEDLRGAAHLHRLLQALLDYPPPVHRHHRLILGPDGRRLAKRDAAATLAAMRDAGVTPAEVRTRLTGESSGPEI